MKTIYNRMLLMASLCILFVACGKNDEPVNNVTLAISGGMEVTVDGTDASKDVTITSSAAAVSPITVTLTSSATGGESSFESTTVTIEKGQTTASTKIIFPVAKFPVAAAEMKITVSGSTSTPGATFDPAAAETNFFVKGVGGHILAPELTILPIKTSINTTDEDGVAEFLVDLTKAIENDLTVAWEYGADFKMKNEDITWTPATIVIPRGSLSAKVSIKVKQGVSGEMPIVFSITDKSVAFEPLTLTFYFEAETRGEKPVNLCGIPALYISYAFVKTFTVGNYTLNPEHTMDGQYTYANNVNIISAKITEGGTMSIQLQNNRSQAGEPYTLVAWVDWNRNGSLTDKERVLYKTISAPAKGGGIAPAYVTTLKAPAGTPDGKYYMRIGQYFNDEHFLQGGCGQIDSGDLMDITIEYTAQGETEASIAASGATSFYVVDRDIVKTFTISLSKTSTKAVTLNIETTRTGSDSSTPNASSITIPAGQVSAEGTITFKASDFNTPAKQSLVTLTISSTDAAISETAKSIVFDVKAVPAEGLPPVALCTFANGFANYIYTKSFTVGNYTLKPEHEPNFEFRLYGYTDMSGTAPSQFKPVTAKVAEGATISITYGNIDSGPKDPYLAAAWVDWNKDGKVSDNEKVIYHKWSPGNITMGVVGTITGTLTAPAGTIAGTYIMRIGTAHDSGSLTGGCGTSQNSDMNDIRIDYSK